MLGFPVCEDLAFRSLPQSQSRIELLVPDYAFGFLRFDHGDITTTVRLLILRGCGLICYKKS